MIFQYSFLWIIPILLVSGVFAYFKYKKIAKLPDVSRGMNLLISSLRFLTILVLFILILQPQIVINNTTGEKPTIVLLVDNSMSLLNSKDSLYFKNEYPSDIEDIFSPLDTRYNLERFTFGRDVSKNKAVDFSEHYTDISKALRFVDNNYKHNPPTHVFLLSDGIYNTGLNPRYKVNSYKVNTVLLGDTTVYPDVFIKSTLVDKYNFLNTIFPVKVDISAIGRNGKSIKCSLLENNKVIGSKDIYINSDNFLTEITFEVEAKQKGLRRYEVVVETGFEEYSRSNNKIEIFTEILDNSGSIILYYGSPHPDISGITEAIRSAGIYNYEMKSLSDYSKNDKTNLIILHNPDPKSAAYQRLKTDATTKRTPIWYVLTERDLINAFSGSDYSVNLNATINENAVPAFNRTFPYFEFTDEEIKAYSAYPPLVVPFGEIKANSGKNLFVQRIKNIDTGNSVMTFYDRNGIKTAYLFGEGIWRWRLFSFRENGSHDIFNTWVHKTVNYLLLRRNNERFVHDVKNLYDETEEIVINAELYNESFELVNTPDVDFYLKKDGKEFAYKMNRNGDKYRITLGNLSAGDYRFSMRTNLKGETFQKDGSFFVRAQNPELNDIVADWNLLKSIAVNSGGKSVELSGLQGLIDEVRATPIEHKVEKSELKYVGLIEMKWLGIILLLLLCLEWFLLKYYTD